jgi:3-oxoacyl-[acyl-carrier-protein] synthase II
VYAGAVEEHSGARELLSDGRLLGEAGALLFLQTAAAGNRPALAEVVASRTRIGEPRRALAECLRDAMAGYAPGDVWGLASGGGAPEVSETEHEAAGAVLGQRVEAVVRPAELVGDTGAASGVLGIAALLAMAEVDASARGRLAVTTSVDPDGMVGCVVLRIPAATPGGTQGVSG